MDCYVSLPDVYFYLIGVSKYILSVLSRILTLDRCAQLGKGLINGSLLEGKNLEGPGSRRRSSCIK